VRDISSSDNALAGSSVVRAEALQLQEGQTPAEAIALLYQRILKRDADDGGLNAWVAAFNAGTSLEDIARTLINSGEAQAIAAPLIRLYEAAFGRNADQDGLTVWANALRSGQSLLEIAEGFTTSQEFINLYGDTADQTAFITALYRNVLDREPLEGEVQAWLDTNSTDAQLLIGFSESPEFQQRAAPEIVEHLLEVADGGTPNTAESLFEEETGGDDEPATPVEPDDGIGDSGDSGGGGGSNSGAPRASAGEPQSSSGEDNDIINGDESVSVTFTFNEDVTGVALEDFEVVDSTGDVVDTALLMTTDGANTSASFTVIWNPDDGIEGEFRIVLSGDFEDLAGNAGIGDRSDRFTVDTLAPDAPVFAGEGDETERSYAENQTDTDAVIATVEVEEDTLYTITGGDDDGFFEIDEDRGEITLTQEGLDGETNDAEEGNNEFTLTITATDEAGNATSADLTLNVTDVNEAPVAVDFVSNAEVFGNDDYIWDILALISADLTDGALGVRNEGAGLPQGEIAADVDSRLFSSDFFLIDNTVMIEGENGTFSLANVGLQYALDGNNLGELTFDPNAEGVTYDFAALAEGETVDITVGVEITDTIDSSLSDTATFTFTVIGVGDQVPDADGF